MSYALYYHYANLGDVLVIKLSDELGTHHKQDGNLVIIYHDDHVIGYNIFNISQTIKIKAHGLIPLPNEALINVINSILANANEPKLPLLTNSGFVVGYVLEAYPHPDSSHLSITKVDIGHEVLDIVCGAKNVAQGQKVVVATVGTFMFDGMEIKPGKLLGVPSNGMICSARELNLATASTPPGILVLDENTLVGSDFFTIEGRMI